MITETERDQYLPYIFIQILYKGSLGGVCFMLIHIGTNLTDGVRLSKERKTVTVVVP